MWRVTRPGALVAKALCGDVVCVTLMGAAYWLDSGEKELAIVHEDGAARAWVSLEKGALHVRLCVIGLTKARSARLELVARVETEKGTSEASIEVARVLKAVWIRCYSSTLRSRWQYC